MALFAPQLISLTCSGSVLYFTDGCLCGKVMFCQHIYKCPLCLHTSWKSISMVNHCAHFSPTVLFREYKARLCSLPLICSTDLWNKARQRIFCLFICIRKGSLKVQKSKIFLLLFFFILFFTLYSVWWTALVSLFSRTSSRKQCINGKTRRK